MGKTINTKIDDGILNFTFTNSEDVIFSSFHLNPSDISLASRCEDVFEYFSKMEQEAPEGATVKDAEDYKNKIQEQFSYMLGYDATEELFGVVDATTVLPNGSLFAYVILDKIASAIGPEMEKRYKAMSKSISKYTTKYHK